MSSFAFLIHLPLPLPPFPPYSHLLSQLHCANFGTFAALARGLSTLHSSVFPRFQGLLEAQLYSPCSVLSGVPKSTPIAI
jgi:hypothetical protein